MNEEKHEYRIEGRPSTIFRTVKNKENPYVMIDRRPIDNPELSFKAKGILTYLMSRPDGWEVSVADLFNHAKDGEDAIRSGLSELRDAGHMKYTQSRQQGRITGMLIEVFEVPNTSPHADFPDVEKPDVENPTQVLKTLSNTEMNHKPLNKKHLTIQEQANLSVDAMLEIAQMPGAKKQLVKEYIFERIKSKLGMNPSGKDAENFIDYAAGEHKKGKSFDVFLEWYVENNPNPVYWSFRRMEQVYPMAFTPQSKQAEKKPASYYGPSGI